MAAVRVLLCATFLWAAVGKIADWSAFRDATRALGVPRLLDLPVAAAVPLIEILVCVSLLPGRTARSAAVAGGALTLAFTALIAANLVQGRRPACNCFGARTEAPISGRSLMRNGVLIAGFVAVSLDRHPTGVGKATADVVLGHSSAATAVTLLVAVVALEAFLIAQVWLRRPAGTASTPTEAETYGLPIGTPAPSFVLPDLHGVDRSLGSLAKPEQPLLIAFIDPQCGPCQALLPELADWKQTYAEALSIAVLSRGGVEENRAKIGDLDLEPVLVQELDEVAAAFAARATPSAVLVSGGRRVVATAAGAHAIRHVVEDAVASAAANGSTLPSLPVGSDAPLFALPSMSGEAEITLLGARGRLALLVFWSPTCGFCNELAPRLKSWESGLDPEHGPRLIVLSDGRPTASDTPFGTVGLDSGQLLRRAYGVTGTPMAVLIDAEGRLASDVVVGAEATMALARRADGLTRVADRLTGQSRRIPVVADQS